MYIILTLIPLLAGCGDKRETARGAMPVPEISVARPVVKDITLTKEYPGYLSSEKTVDLVARVNGTLQTIAYAPGSRVRKGQVLFVIEPTIYQDNVKQTEQLCPYAGSCEKRCCKPDTGVTVEIECRHFASGSQQCRSRAEYSTHESGLLHSPGTV